AGERVQDGERTARRQPEDRAVVSGAAGKRRPVEVAVGRQDERRGRAYRIRAGKRVEKPKVILRAGDARQDQHHRRHGKGGELERCVTERGGFRASHEHSRYASGAPTPTPPPSVEARWTQLMNEVLRT